MSTADNVWGALVGQGRAVDTLQRAVEAAQRMPHGLVPGADGNAMTHAWLFTGPPGSGRSVAARAFAAALLCGSGGCGVCNSCRTVASGANPDVVICRTEQKIIPVDQVRELTSKAAMSPMTGRWQVIIIEDADRIEERSSGALLKSLEEPPPRTIWILCAPTAEDMMATIRSRTREVRLVTPSEADIVELLVHHYGAAPDIAEEAARAAQGHIGRAKALASDQAARDARQRIVDLPGSWTSLAACLTTAADVAASAQAQAEAQTAELDQQERRELDQALGFSTKGAKPRNAATAITALEDQQKARAKRLQRDAIDNVLTELSTWYRDVLCIQMGASENTLINGAISQRLREAAAATTAEQTTGCLEAILTTRRALDTNVAPLLALEALFADLMGRGTAKPL